MNFTIPQDSIERMKIASFLFRFDYFVDEPVFVDEINRAVKTLFDVAVTENALNAEMCTSILEMVEALFEYYDARAEWEDGAMDEDNEPQEPPIASFEDIAEFIDERLRSYGVDIPTHRSAGTDIRSGGIPVPSTQQRPLVAKPMIDLTKPSTQSINEQPTIHL